MTQNETSVTNKRPAGKTVRPSGKRTAPKVTPATAVKPKGYIINDWDIVLEKKVSAKKLMAIVEELLNQVRGHTFEDKLPTASLQYQLYRNVDLELLYSLKVFRQVKVEKGNELMSLRATPVSAGQVPGISSGTPDPKPADPDSATPETSQVPSTSPTPTAPPPSTASISAPLATASQVPSASPGPRAPAPPAGVREIIER